MSTYSEVIGAIGLTTVVIIVAFVGAAVIKEVIKGWR